MPIRTAEAEWKGDLAGGTGAVRSESGALDGTYSAASRFEDGAGTNPDELLAAAHSGCFAMALAHVLDQAGYDPERVTARARVHLEQKEDGPAITRIELLCEATVPDIDDDTFQEHAEAAKEGCPVSRALAATPIDLEARLSG